MRIACHEYIAALSINSVEGKKSVLASIENHQLVNLSETMNPDSDYLSAAMDLEGRSQYESFPFALGTTRDQCQDDKLAVYISHSTWYGSRLIFPGWYSFPLIRSTQTEESRVVGSTSSSISALVMLIKHRIFSP